MFDLGLVVNGAAKPVSRRASALVKRRRQHPRHRRRRPDAGVEHPPLAAAAWRGRNLGRRLKQPQPFGGAVAHGPPQPFGAPLGTSLEPVDASMQEAGEGAGPAGAFSFEPGGRLPRQRQQRRSTAPFGRRGRGQRGARPQLRGDDPRVLHAQEVGLPEGRPAGGHAGMGRRPVALI